MLKNRKRNWTRDDEKWAINGLMKSQFIAMYRIMSLFNLYYLRLMCML